MNDTPPSKNTTINVTVPIAIIAVAAIIALFGIYYVSAPQDRSAILSLLGPFVSTVMTFFLSRRLGNVESRIDEGLNGKLDAKIEAAIRRVLPGGNR